MRDPPSQASDPRPSMLRATVLRFDSVEAFGWFAGLAGCFLQFAMTLMSAGSSISTNFPLEVQVRVVMVLRWGVSPCAAQSA